MLSWFSALIMQNIKDSEKSSLVYKGQYQLQISLVARKINQLSSGATLSARPCI